MGEKSEKAIANRSPSPGCEGKGSAECGFRSNGLGRLAGGWSEEEFRDFERATAPFKLLDGEAGHCATGTDASGAFRPS
jgi:hypothetical protein